MTRAVNTVRRAAAALIVAGLVGAAASASAQQTTEQSTKQPTQEDTAKPNTGRVSLSLGADWTTDYYFRGIRQEDDGFILQPYAEVTFKLVEGTPAFGNLGLTVGLWNSLHGGDTGTGGLNDSPKAWYEADFYTKIGFTFLERFNAGVIYTAYMSPNGFFETVQELAFSLAFDDSALLGPFSLKPSALIAFEVAGQADAGRDKGTYLQLGVSPGYTFNDKGAYPVTLSFPLVVGLSLDEYYEFATGDDETFGFLQAGVQVSVPLAFIPPSLGAWAVKGGVSFLTLGDNLRDVNRGDRNEVIGTVGLTFTY